MAQEAWTEEYEGLSSGSAGIIRQTAGISKSAW